MTTNWMAIVGAPALVAPLVLCTSTGNTADSNAAAHNWLVRVNTQTPATFDADAWKDRLRSSDLEAREHDFERLIGEARGNDAARKQLEAWAHDDGDANLAWTSRLALREMRSGWSSSSPFSAMPHGSMQGMPWNDLRSRMDDLQSRFGGLDSMFDDLQREMDQAFQGMPPPGQMQPGQMQPGQIPPGPGGLSSTQSKSYSMQVDQDGVKVEVSQDVNGKQETQTYSAKTLDELYAAHPELKDQLGLHVGGQTPGGLGRLTPPPASPFGSWHGLTQDDDRPAIPLNPGAMRKDVLGVRVSTPSDDDRSAAKLDDGVGLKVASVQPGTIASRIGVQPGDLVVDINGHAVKSVDDVRTTLDARKDGEDVAVTVVDEKGQKRVLTWRASSERQL